MQKIIILVLLFSQALQSFAAVTFPDIENSFYRDAVVTLASEGVISGFEDGTFGADKTITRAEILKIFLRAKWTVLTDTPKIRCFRDVGLTLWYHPYICEGAKLGIVKGFDDGSFGPDKPVTVLEALAIGLRLYGLAPANGSPWYLPYQDFANTNGIIDTHSYSLATPMSRGKASELILSIREYSTKRSPLQSLSKWCTTPWTLGSTNTMQIAGKTRSYLLYVPPGYSSSTPVWLIIAIHGRTNSNTQVQWYMGLEGSRRGGGWQTEYIVAYPAGLDAGGGSRSWSAEENVTFFDAMIRDIGDKYCIERSDVMVVAHSLGASFASKLACVRGDIIHAMGIVGGGGWTSSCNQTPTATLIYQNANDTLSSPATARATENMMRGANTCGATTETVMIGSLSCKRWKDCSTGNPVVWCEWYPTYGGDPHSWPTSGGADILGFFRALN